MSKAVGSRQTAVGSWVDALRARKLFLILACCLLPFALLLFASFKRREAEAVAPLSEAEADAALLVAAREALGGREGAVVVMDARTGRVRALAGGRAAFEEATPPGSAVKPFTLLAALRAGSLAEGERLNCRGGYERRDFKINCSHPRYRKAFGPAQALANSCNYFFAHTAESLDAEVYERTLSDFGFGATTGGGGESEVPGLLPRDAPGVAEMLGESEQLRVTPAQLASAYASLFNGGVLLAPRQGRAEGFTPTVRARLEVSDAHRTLLLAGMRGAVAYGTASGAGLATLPVYVFGKTGTSTPLDGWRSQGWFAGFAVAGGEFDESVANGRHDFASGAAREVAPENVRLAVVVLLKRSTGSEAATVARPVFEAYARTLGRAGRTERLAGRSDESHSDDDGRGATLSSSNAEGDGATVRVRLTRDDATLPLGLEDYVFGVLAAEGSVETEPEALKALAVVARTYAVGNLRRHARDRFDLCDTTHCQRYAPVRDESARPDFYELARRAVRETAGQVLRDSRGRVAESYFSASCGGATADVQKLWGAAHAPAHLRGVRDDECAGSTRKWADVIPAARLARALHADERSDVGERVEGVRVVRRDRTGRAEAVEVVGARRRQLRGWDFKIIVGRTLGWSVLKSSRFEVTRAGSAFVFRGTGFGHGLGLCQAGAHVSAGRGASYRQILARYFQGAPVGELRREDFGLRSETAGVKVDEGDVVEGQMRKPDREGGRLQLTSYVSGRTDALPHGRASALEAGRQVRSEHFRVRHPARAGRGEVESLLRTLEAAYADVARRLERAGVGVAVPDVEVTVYETTGDFVGATGQPAWVAGVTEGRRISLQPLDVLRRRGMQLTTPRHEFVHAALEAIGAGRAPLWLVEGLAAHFAGEGRALGRATKGERLSIEELERRLARPASAAEMRALYAAAYAEVGALIRREGEPAVWRRALR